jgi:hypothetical protein
VWPLSGGRSHTTGFRHAIAGKANACEAEQHITQVDASGTALPIVYEHLVYCWTTFICWAKIFRVVNSPKPSPAASEETS